MKTIRIFNSEFEARLVAGKLESEGFTVFLNGAREYASVVVGGGGQGRYELQVPAEEADDARLALARTVTDTDVTIIHPTAGLALKKAIVFAGLSLSMVPLVFNFYSVKNAALYFRLENNYFKKIIWLFLIALLNAMTMWIVVKAATAYFEST